MPPSRDKDGEQTATDTPMVAGSAETTPDDQTPLTSSGESDHQPEGIEEPKSMADAIERAFEAAPTDEAIDSAPKTDGETDDDADADGEEGDGTPANEGEADGEAEDAEADEAPDEAEPEAGETPDDDPSEEELNQMGRKARGRISKLLAQRREARDEAANFKSEANNYKAVRTYMSENNLHDAEVADLFKVGADLKSGDPQRLQGFLDRIAPLVQMALEATGQAVPQDLQEQVETGDMTTEAAQMVARSRYNEQLATDRLERNRQQVQQSQGAQQQRNIASAINTWFNEIQVADPDFGEKTAAMRRVAQAIVAEQGLPKTPEQALTQAKAAYAEVNQMLRPKAAARKATRPAPTTAGNAAPRRSGVQPVPTSLEDVINQALGG